MFDIIHCSVDITHIIHNLTNIIEKALILTETVVELVVLLDLLCKLTFVPYIDLLLVCVAQLLSIF